MTGELLRPLSKKADWELEEVKGSTNRLTIEIPLSDGFGVTTDQELLFRKKRYVITEVRRYRGSGSITVIADESQIELSDRNIKKFSLKKTILPDAMKKAVSGSNWTVGYVYADGKDYFAEIENKSSMYCLSFLENQSGGRLIFDSVKRTVSMAMLEEDIPDRVFRYKQNMDDISKTEVQPQATIIYPYGKDGMSISSINGNVPYLEDFSWYTALGVDIKVARAKYSKEFVWKDDRYIYAGNLLRDAEKKLATMANPQINYSIKASGTEAEDLTLSDAVFVVDEELGVKLKALVARLRICKDSSKNEIELDYLPSSLGDIFDDGSLGDSSGGTNEVAVFQVKNPAKVDITVVPSIALSASVSVYTSTYFEVGLTMVLNCTTAGLLEGHFMMDGNRMTTEIKQTVTEGWHTIGLPFIITQVQEGTKFLDFYLSTTGSISIDVERAELYVKSQGAFGGASNERPDQRITEDVELIKKVADINDNVAVIFNELIRVNTVDTVVPVMLIPTITERVRNAVEMQKAREDFALVSNFDDTVFIMPTQDVINNFIDTYYPNTAVFKVITVGDHWSVFTTLGRDVHVDHDTRFVYSDAEMFTVDANYLNEPRGTVVDWSSLEGDIVVHEVYRRV